MNGVLMQKTESLHNHYKSISMEYSRRIKDDHITLVDFLEFRGLNVRDFNDAILSELDSETLEHVDHFIDAWNNLTHFHEFLEDGLINTAELIAIAKADSSLQSMFFRVLSRC